LDKAELQLPEGKLLKAIIGPHAGFAYSGPTAAWAYKNIDPEKYKWVFLLGPAHHTFTDGCALSQQEVFDTPLGPINIDWEITEELKKKWGFSYYTKEDDEAEHSLELHSPFIKKIFGDHEFKLIPIVVGSVSYKKE